MDIARKSLSRGSARYCGLGTRVRSHRLPPGPSAICQWEAAHATARIRRVSTTASERGAIECAGLRGPPVEPASALLHAGWVETHVTDHGSDCRGGPCPGDEPRGIVLDSEPSAKVLHTVTRDAGVPLIVVGMKCYRARGIIIHPCASRSIFCWLVHHFQQVQYLSGTQVMRLSVFRQPRQRARSKQASAGGQRERCGSGHPCCRGQMV